LEEEKFAKPTKKVQCRKKVPPVHPKATARFSIPIIYIYNVYNIGTKKKSFRKYKRV